MPIFFTEVGWSSYYDSTQQDQVQYLNYLTTLLSPVKAVNVIWALENDTSGYFPSEITPLNNIGLRNYDGTPKPAWGQAFQLINWELLVNPAVPGQQ